MLKRCLDIIGALSGLILLSPIIVILCVMVKRRLGSPVLFHQIRPGKDGVPFKMIKFRTMTDADGIPLPDSERITPFGAKLRSTSLDELPELWNVLKGEMSLVGPRPLLMDYMPLYSKRQARRHELRPGVTGWAQINGRNAIAWPEKLNLDIWYVENRTLWLDIKIIALTIKKVVKRNDISATGEITMPKFTGEE